VAFDEGDRHPDARARRIDRLGDAAEGAVAVDDRPDGVACPGRVAASQRRRNRLGHALVLVAKPGTARTWDEPIAKAEISKREAGGRSPPPWPFPYCETTAEISPAVSLMSKADVLPALVSTRWQFNVTVIAVLKLLAITKGSA